MVEASPLVSERDRHVWREYVNRHTGDHEAIGKYAVCVVEATAWERQQLWLGYSVEGGRFEGSAPCCRDRSDWYQVLSGSGAKVGTVQTGTWPVRRIWPVFISLVYHIINDQLVVFWEPISPMVDYNAIRAWLDQNYPAHRQLATRVDPGSFHQVIDCITELNAAGKYPRPPENWLG